MKNHSWLSWVSGSSLIALTVFAVNCQRGQNSTGLRATHLNLGDSNFSVQVLGTQTLADQAQAGTVTLTATSPTSSESLVVQIPRGQLDQNYVMGAVVTHVSVHDDPSFGDLKFGNTPGYNVKVRLIGESSGTPRLVFMGCAQACSESSLQTALFTAPVVAVNKDSVTVDLAVLGQNMSFVKELIPDDGSAGFTAANSKAVSVELSASTLVFDTVSDLTSSPAPEKAPATPPQVTLRWYLKLASSLDPYFIPRSPVSAVGFFQTQTNASPKIARHALTRADEFGVKYYIKNVPAEFQPAFKAAFDEWNEKLFPQFGKKFFEYELINAPDPRVNTIVAGDIRYKVIEWDLTDLASYGGLGPSIPNEATGETMWSSVLIQGPTIVTLYTKWYKVAEEVKALQAAGKMDEAEALIVKMNEEQTKILERPQSTLRAQVNSKVLLKLNSQIPALHDPLMENLDFEDLPPNVSYSAYMAGYFQNMVAHELGHNLGLRHNFKGSLASEAGDPSLGKVSSSVMEYLGRPFRYLQRIGQYDIDALAYGYNGVTPPDNTPLFCTDEDGVNASQPYVSAECSSSDATNDPYGWLESRLKKAIDRLIARGSKNAPVWTVSQMSTPLGVAIHGLASYAASASTTGSTWVDFFTHSGRPQDPIDVGPFVVARLKAQLCDPSIEVELKAKVDEKARQASTKNLSDLRGGAAMMVKPYGIAPSEIQCN